jgi:hypothetical protein
MNSNPEPYNTQLEKALIGRWTAIDPEPGNAEEYTFKPNNAFTAVILERADKSKSNVYGYWEIIGSDLRIGTGPDQVTKATITFHGDQISIKTPNGNTIQWLRKQKSP